MRNRKGIFISLAVCAVWLSVWQAAHMLVYAGMGTSLLLPSPAETFLRLRQLLAHVGSIFLPVACRDKGVRLQVSLQPKLHQAVQIGGLIGSNHSRFVPFFEIGAHRPKHRTVPNKF